MLKWLRGLREKTKPIAEDANRIVAKPSERSEPSCDPDPIVELVRIVGEAHLDDPRSHSDADPPRARRIRLRRSERRR